MEENQDNKCCFDKAWIGKCKKPVLEGLKMCEEHSKLKCCSCGAPATRECDETMGLVCGADLCDNCEHTIQSNGCNSGGTLPEGMRSHCRKDKQIYEPWYKRLRKNDIADKTIASGERIVCAAVRYKAKSDDPYTNVCGFRHADCYAIMQALVPQVKFDDLPGREEQGFLTSHNRYVDRAEAFKIAKANKQIIHNMHDDDEEGQLTSEDLY